MAERRTQLAEDKYAELSAPHCMMGKRAEQGWEGVRGEMEVKEKEKDVVEEAEERGKGEGEREEGGWLWWVLEAQLSYSGVLSQWEAATSPLRWIPLPLPWHVADLAATMLLLLPKTWG